jgi:hypothetical protein
MAVNFPNSPTNGQTVTVDGVTYSWNAAGSVWDIVTTATATVAVTAPVVNTGTSTAAVLGFATNPSLSGVVNTNGGYKIDSSSQYKAYEYFNNGTRRAVLYTEETQQQLVIQNEGTGPVVIQNGGQNRMNIGSNGHITMSAQPMWNSDISSGTNIYSTFTARINVGFTQTNSSTITVQTAGKYYVRAQQLLQTAGGGYWQLQKNNVNQKHAYASTSTFMDYNVGALLDLAAGDTIRIFTTITLTNSWNSDHSTLDIIKVA